MPAELLLLETDCPYLSPVPHRGKPNRPAYVLETLKAVAAMRGVEAARAGRAGRGQRRARLRPAVNAPRQVTLARLAELGLRPDTELGQHFLVDDNLLGVIERLAALRADDVALEIGAGVGTLTARLAERCAHVHAVEIDRRLEPALTRTLQGFDERDRALGRRDAHRPRPRFEPPPTAFVANLPYHVAAPLVLDSIGGLPAVQRWCVLVQREIAERLTAGPGRRALRRAQRPLRARARADRPPRRLAQRLRARAERRLGARRVRAPGRSGRELAGDWPQIVATVRAAFAYRRKTLANALDARPAGAT